MTKAKKSAKKKTTKATKKTATKAKAKATTKTVAAPAAKAAVTRQVRQGDVFLMQVEKVTGETEPMPIDPRGIVLAEGETSSHYHAVIGGGAKLSRFRDGRDERLLEVTSTAELRVIGGSAGGVDRHTPITISPGKYLVRVQRAMDAANSRQVND